MPLADAVRAAVRAHCESKGFREGATVNNFVPHDVVAAFAMAEALVRLGFDRYVAIAPEGHIYGWFFEQLGVSVGGVLVDYPPTRCLPHGDIDVRGQRTLLIEDDVIGGRTLRLVVEYLRGLSPTSLSLCLGHGKSIQHLANVPSAIDQVFVADDFAPFGRRQDAETRFREFFAARL